VSLRAEHGRYFRADKPTTADDYDLHDEPFNVGMTAPRATQGPYRRGRLNQARRHCLGVLRFRTLRFITNRFTGEFQVEAFAQFGDTVDIHLQFVSRTEFI
jgi:hypothetical protein